MRVTLLRWVLTLLLASCDAGFTFPAENSPDNKTLMQYFEWFLPNDGMHWLRLDRDAEHLSTIGITAVWIPPPYKGMSQDDVGYGSYDYYDLGEFNQKGTVRTKYGTKEQLQQATHSLHAAGVDVYADMVLNHKGGADRTELVKAKAKKLDDRNTDAGGGAYQIQAWTRFDFPGRRGKYSTFRWNWQHFDGVDWNESGEHDLNKTDKKVFLFEGKNWDWPVSATNGNYDFLLLDDIDYDNQDVQQEMKTWGTWMVNELDLDGFRLDAVKHIKYDYIVEWLNDIREATGKPLFTVAEYWSDLGEIQHYINQTGNHSVLDFPLRDKFKAYSRGNGNLDMGALLNGTLLKADPERAVTFVENHDTQAGKERYDSDVLSWFKPLAYAFILTWDTGYPMVFYADYYGGARAGEEESLQKILDQLLRARRDLAYGKLNNYLDHRDLVGWTREGDDQHPGSGLAALITDRDGGTKKMKVGSQHAGEVWVDITGNSPERVTIDLNGEGVFAVKGGSVSVYAAENG